MSHTTLFHIVDAAEWKSAEEAGQYTPSSLATEGFIHLSTRDQVVHVANQRYFGRVGLLLVEIDSAHVEPEIRWEDSHGTGELFPHLYGPLDPGAVTRVHGFDCDADGGFRLTDLP